ncbi:MAG: hypothetical protein IJM83_10610 [Firmicutes bacterium]|nr:hypothetical protein [Bacillota bacterium]
MIDYNKERYALHSPYCGGEDGMDKKCSKCGGKLIEGVLLDAFSLHSVIFTPMEELTKIKKIKTGVICDVCTQCGSIENLRVEDPSQLRKPV